MDLRYYNRSWLCGRLEPISCGLELVDRVGGFGMRPRTLSAIVGQVLVEFLFVNAFVR